MRFAPLFGRFCPIFLHLVQELTPNFGDSRNEFCNIFVTILPHLFRFGETSFYGGKKCRFSSFSGRGGGLFRQRACPLRHGLRRATSPKVGGKSSSATFLALPSGELSSEARLRGLACHFRQQPCPLRQRLSALPHYPPFVAARHLPPAGGSLSRSGRQGLFRCVLGSPFGRAVAVRRLRGLIFPSARLRGQTKNTLNEGVFVYGPGRT